MQQGESGRLPAVRWTALPAVALLVLGTALGVAGCKGIDKSQWASATQSSSPRASASVTAASTGDLGITTGSNAGAAATTSATVVLEAPADTCWSLTLDGLTHRGCGNATFTDTRGTAAARVTKTRGTGAVTLTLEAGGQAMDTGSVSTANRFVTVIEPQAR